MSNVKELNDFNTSELFVELNRRGYCKNPIIDIEFVKYAFREFEANHELDIDISDKNLLKLADIILGNEKFISSIELELSLGFRRKIIKIIEEGLAKS